MKSLIGLPFLGIFFPLVAVSSQITVNVVDFKSAPSAQARRARLVEIAQNELAFWKQHGATVRDGNLSIYVQPEEQTSYNAYFGQIVGGNWVEEVSPTLSLLRQGRLALDTLFQQIQQFDRTLPPFFSGEFRSQEFLATLSQAETDAVQSEFMIRLGRILSDPNAPIRWRGQGLAVAYYEYRGLEDLGLVSLNRTPYPDEKDSWEYDEVLAHEIGHLIHYMQWESQGAFPVDFALQDTTTNELIADFFGHIFLETDGCHRRRITHQPWEGECSRTLNPESRFPTIESEIINSISNHEGGKIVRKFLWSSYLRIGRDRFAKAFVTAVKGLETFLRAKSYGAFSKEEVFFDPFLQPVMKDHWQHQTLTQLLSVFCSASQDPSCDLLPTLTEGRAIITRLEKAQEFAPIRMARDNRFIPVNTDTGENWKLSFSYTPRDSLNPPSFLSHLASPGGTVEVAKDYSFSGSYGGKACLDIDFLVTGKKVQYCDDGKASFTSNPEVRGLINENQDEFEIVKFQIRH